MRVKQLRSKRKSLRVRAGENIGKGSNSRSVEYPALPCKDGRYISPTLVSKQTTEKVAEEEYKNVEGWPKEAYPHLLFPVMMCEGATDYQVYAPYAKGTTFRTFLQQKKISQDDLYACFVAMETLAHEVYRFNKNGYRHNDVHESNVMYDPVTSTAVLIDFGLASRSRSPSRRGFATGPYGDFVNLRRLVREVENRLKSSLDVKRYNFF